MINKGWTAAVVVVTYSTVMCLLPGSYVPLLCLEDGSYLQTTGTMFSIRPTLHGHICCSLLNNYIFKSIFGFLCDRPLLSSLVLNFPLSGQSHYASNSNYSETREESELKTHSFFYPDEKIRVFFFFALFGVASRFVFSV